MSQERAMAKLSERLLELRADVVAYRHDLADGRVVTVERQLFGARICIGHPEEESYQDCWDYDDTTAAITKAMFWNPATTPEPVGWVRHARTGRRRPQGDASREHRD